MLENLNLAEILVFVGLVVGIARLWSMPTRMDRFEKRMDGLEADHKAVMDRIDEVNTRIDGVHSEINKLYSLLPSIK